MVQKHQALSNGNTNPQKGHTVIYNMTIWSSTQSRFK